MGFFRVEGMDYSKYRLSLLLEVRKNQNYYRIMYCWDYIGSPCRSIINSISTEIILPVIVQPVLVLFITCVIPNNIVFISVIICISLIIIISLSKHDLRSHLLYYWIVLSITYTTVVFEFIVVPLSEIEPKENFFLILFTVLSIFFLYLTSASMNNKPVSDGEIGESINRELLSNGNGYVCICPVCRIKMLPRNYHCNICQECIQKYDHHSYWLNCCISEINLHYYVAGIFFGIFALVYASLLILTTVCSPDFKFGVLLPQDCTDVGENIEMCACIVCGIYCLELAVLLLFKVLLHIYLISRGLSLFEWKEQYGYKLQFNSPYSNGLKENWIKFFRKFKKITF